VTDVDMAGEEFMRTVFHLERGQIGVAVNGSKTHGLRDSVERLERHRAKYFGKGVRGRDIHKVCVGADGERAQIYPRLVGRIKSSAGMEWKRKADRMADSGRGRKKKNKPAGIGDQPPRITAFDRERPKSTAFG